MGRHVEHTPSGLSKIFRSRRRTHTDALTIVVKSPAKVATVPASHMRPQVRKSQQWKSARVSFYNGRARMVFSAAFFATVGVLFVNVIDPYSGATASPYYQPAVYAAGPNQELAVGGVYANAAGRDGITLGVAAAIAAATAPNAGIPVNPASAQAIAYEIVRARGWGQEQYNCLVALWSRESNWRVNASNPSSGAYGIPQALPGSKMASAGADWQTNPATQIAWGLSYISSRYGSPCGAWAHSEAVRWY